MSAMALGEAAAELPWLSPGAASLVALARSTILAAWNELRCDPGAVALVLRCGRPPGVFSTSILPQLLDAAASRLERPDPGFADWNEAGASTVYRSALTFAHIARSLAERTRRCDPETAWSVALLAPLGWMAVCAVDPRQVDICLEDADFASDPAAAQQRLWGMDHASIVRRLCRRWGVAQSWAAIIGHLDLPTEHAVALGADAELFPVVQLSVALAQTIGSPLHLSVGPASEAASVSRELGRQLSLAPEAIDAIREAANSRVAHATPTAWEAPQQMPLLRDLLVLAAEKHRGSESQAVLRLESDVDHLHQALRHQRRSESARLHTLKLNSLAQFAAGAGHEINNPLAVISGQAQYLLSHEPDPGRQRSLQAIIGQTKRIHQILSELMQFARPATPKKQACDVAAITQEVVASLGEWADQLRIQVRYTPPSRDLTLLADPGQIQTAIRCLLRNAVEASPTDGCVSVRVDVGDRVEWIIEDNGGGPSDTQEEHLFDPFYSGRQAGRGRGLGLPTAWQLVRQHGGEVRYAGVHDGVTRFVMSLPIEPVPPAERQAMSLSPGFEIADPPNGLAYRNGPL